MQKSSINPMPGYFDRYINLVREDDLFEALENSKQAIEKIDISTLKKIGSKNYQAGKWTVNDIFQHIIDNERIQSYRALRFARKDSTTLPGYDEELLGRNSFATNRTIEDILQELLTVRNSSIQLYKSFDRSVFQNSGICFNQNLSVLAIGFVIVGHQIHHLNVVREKYETLE